MKLEGKKVLVTGAGGFIGSHLTEGLVKIGASVRALVKYNSRNDWGLLEMLPDDVKNGLEVVAGDVRDPFMVKKAVTGCDVVFHLASLIAIPYSYVAPASYVETNVGGAVNVLQAAMETGVEKVVHTSTSEVYGTALYTPIDEKHPLQGQSPYSASKIGADKIAESYHLSFGLPVATIRPFNAYGPRQSARAIIPTVISGTPEVIIPFGSEKNVSSHHIFPMILPDHVDRAAFMEKMRHAKGVQTSIHYPPVHTFELYRRLGRPHPDDLTQTDLAGGREVTLPLYPALSEEDVTHIVESTKELIDA